jgi:hypothetical protein
LLIAMAVLVLLQGTAQATHQPNPVEGENLTFNPKDAQIVTDPQYSGGKALKLIGVKSAPHTKVTFSEPTDLYVVARSEGWSNTTPGIRVMVDGEATPIRLITNTGAPQQTFFDINIPAGTHTIAVKGVNVNKKQNVFIDALRFYAPYVEPRVVTNSITPWHEQVEFPLIEGNDVTFTWQVSGTYDYVECRLHRVNEDNSLTDLTPWEDCTSLSKTYTDLPDGNLRLSIAVVKVGHINAQTFTHFRVDTTHQFGAPTATAEATPVSEANSFPVSGVGTPLTVQTFIAAHSGRLLQAEAHLANATSPETSSTLLARILESYNGGWRVIGAANMENITNTPKFVAANFDGVWVEEGKQYALALNRPSFSQPSATWTAGSAYGQGAIYTWDGSSAMTPLGADEADGAFRINVAPYVDPATPQ